MNPAPPVTKTFAMLFFYPAFPETLYNFQQFFVVAADVFGGQPLRSQNGVVIRAHGFKQTDSFFQKAPFRAFGHFFNGSAPVSDNRFGIFWETVAAIAAVMLVFNVEPRIPYSGVLGQNMADVVVVYFYLNALFAY